MLNWSLNLMIMMLLLCNISNAQWEKANGGKELPDATGISAVIANGDNIIAATTAGIYISTNNGDNWSQRNNGLTEPYSISELCYKDNLIFAGNMESVFVSSDNGNSWTQKDDGLNSESIYCFLVVDNNIFAGTSGGIYMTGDNGDNWVKKNQGIPNYEYVNSIYNSGGILLAGTSVGVYVSTNNGDNWAKEYFADEVFLITANSTNLFLSMEGYHTGIYVSSNNGNSWTKKSNGLDTDHDMHYFLIADGNRAFAGGTNSGVYVTDDNGNNWIPYNDGLSDYVRQNELMFTSNDKYLFVGSKGTNGFCNLWRRLLNEQNAADEIPADSYLLQVYPNPVSDNLNLRIELPDDDFLTITLNDVLGNTMGIANHELMYKGLNKITIPVSILSEGTYYIRVITSQGTIVKSVVIF